MSPFPDGYFRAPSRRELKFALGWIAAALVIIGLLQLIPDRTMIVDPVYSMDSEQQIRLCAVAPGVPSPADIMLDGTGKFEPIQAAVTSNKRCFRYTAPWVLQDNTFTITLRAEGKVKDAMIFTVHPS